MFLFLFWHISSLLEFQSNQLPGDIYFSRDLSATISINTKAILDTLQYITSIWSPLNLTCWGRLELDKMMLIF